MVALQMLLLAFGCGVLVWMYEPWWARMPLVWGALTFLLVAAAYALLHTLRTNDEERFETLDCAFLAAEDLALCEYVCPMHQDYGAALTALVAHTQRGVR